MKSTPDRDTIILRQLASDYKQIAFQFRLDLRPPLIVFTENKSLWGRWNPQYRTIEIQKQLVLDHSWDTVLYVLKHEMAHQIVTEVFKLADSDHSQSFQRACDLLAVPSDFRRGSGTISETSEWKNKSTKAEALGSVIEKIQKLFALASSTTSEAESASAIARARELTRKYDLHEATMGEEPSEFRYAVVNTGKQRLSPIYSHLAGLLIEHYQVDVIFTSTFNAAKLKPSQCLEIYGRETHVLVAEYVLDFLMRTLEDLWSAHAQDKNVAPIYKKSYQMGILAGFQDRLKRESEILSPIEEPSQRASALMVVEEKQRLQFLQQRYPRLRSRSGSKSWVDNESYARGVADGKDVQIRKGLNNKTRGMLSLKGSVL